MDTQLRELSAERICNDYNGCVDNFERDVNCLKGDKRVHRMTCEDGVTIHFYHREWVKAINGKVKPNYIELHLTDEEQDCILDEFYAWY